MLIIISPSQGDLESASIPSKVRHGTECDLIYPEAVAVDVLGVLRLDGVEFPAGGGRGKQRCDEELAESVQPPWKGLCVHVKVLHSMHHKSH